MIEAVAAPPVTFLEPQWPAPRSVRAVFTLRSGGVSRGPYASLNVGAHVGDDPAAVIENRRRVRVQLSLPAEPEWIEQVHGACVIDLDASATARTGDAVVTRRARQVCAVQVADCLPVLFSARAGGVVGAAHAGWRGLAAGVLEATVARLGAEPRELLAWLGPAIGPGHFEVGGEVRAAFLAHDASAAAAFTANHRGRWQCDLAALARQRLHALGVSEVRGGDWCTFAHPTHFFSYRRDGRCGRMAALIWLD